MSVRAAMELWLPRALRRFGPNTMLRLDSDIRFLSLHEATLYVWGRGEW